MVTTTQSGVDVHRPASTFDPDPIISPTLEGLPSIVSNVNRNWEVQPTGSIPGSAAPDIVGAFRFICQPGQVNWDDPIVYPGVIGGSPHLHQWFGNSLANGESTYKTLRTTGESSCMGPMNRSAYWQPAMMNEAGKVVRPDYISIYYKRLPKSDARCGPTGKNCLALPRGLRYIFGFDMKRMHDAQTAYFTWKCVTPQWGTRGNTQKHFDQLDCPAGNTLMVTLPSPDCWDGKNLDSADHRSHIVYEKRDVNSGQMSCPSTHPYILPQFTIGAAFTVGTGENVKDWYLSSDRMAGMPAMTPGSTFHADWYGAWDDEVLKTWTANCIDKLLNCSAGELGDGTIMRRPDGYSLAASPRLVAAPARPAVSGPPPPILVGTPSPPAPPATSPPADMARRAQIKPKTIRLARPGDTASTTSSSSTPAPVTGIQKMKPAGMRAQTTVGGHSHH